MYNDLNQLTDRAGGNLVAATQETSNGSVWSVSEEWVYQWNPRDQMTRALKDAGAFWRYNSQPSLTSMGSSP